LSSGRSENRSPFRIRCGFLGLLIVLMPVPVHAGGIHWLCWHDGSDETIHCFLDGAVLSAAEEAAEGVETDRLALELPPNLPGFVRELRLNPAGFAQEEIVVPLFAPPDDATRVLELAQAVMCGSRRGCVVAMAPSALSADLLRMLNDDPALD
jgi:hypothetical protein